MINMASSSSNKDAALASSIKYKPDRGTFDCGRTYEENVTAFLSLKALISVDDFCLISNPANCAPFDDVILCTKEASKNVVYLFQIRHKGKPTEILDEEFVKSKMKLSLETLYRKYIQSSEKIKRIIPPYYSEGCKFKFILFTNRPIMTSQILVPSEVAQFATSPSKVYEFNQDFIKYNNPDFLRDIYVYPDHSLDYISDSSVGLIKQYFDVGIEVAAEIKWFYFKCIINWYRINTEKESLTKEFTLKLLLYAAFQHYSIKIDNYNGKITRNFLYKDLLWDTIKNNNLPIGIEHIQYVSEMAVEEFKNLDVKEELFSYYEEIIFDDKFRHQLKYNVGRFLGKLPFIVRDCPVKIPYERCFKIVYIETEQSGSEGNLSKIDADTLHKIKSQTITTSTGQILKIQDFIDVLEDMTISDVLSLIESQSESSTNNESFINRKINKIILDKSIFTVKCDIFIINNKEISNDEFIRHFRLDLSNIIQNPSEIEHDLKNKGEANIILIKDDMNINTNNFGNIHFLKLSRRNDYQIEWMKTIGSTRNIQHFRCNTKCDIIDNDLHYNCDCKCCMFLEDFYNYLNNPFITISGVPGIGKTTFLKQFVKTVPANDYILFVTLSEHYAYFNEVEKNFPKSVEDVLHYFFNKRASVAILNSFFERKLAKKEIIILLDGFDEVAPNYTQVVSKIIQEIRRNGFKIILTTRSVLKYKVELLFDVFAFTLTPFSTLDQRKYVENYFKTYNVRMDYDEYENVILKNVKVDSNFLNVPFNLKFFMESITSDIQYDNNCNLLQLYERYVNHKFKIYLEKFNNFNLDVEAVINYHKYFSINLLFRELPFYKVIEMLVDIKLEDFIMHLKMGGEKIGILIGDANEIFIHRTIAEYFAAKWLFEVFVPKNDRRLLKGERDFAKSIIKLINLSETYNEENNMNFPGVRLFFDLIINEDKLHKAANEGNYEFIKHVVNNDITTVHTLNKFNQTILHTLILNNHPCENLNVCVTVLSLLIQNLKDILNQKDSSDLSIHDIVEQKKLTKPPVKIIIRETLDGAFIYYNRAFRLWEIFRNENLYNCNLQNLMGVLKDQQTKFVSIFTTARNREVQVIEDYCSSGINLDGTRINGKHLLHFAAEGGSLDIVKLLNTYGMQEQMKLIDNDCRNVMHYAVINGNLDLVMYLIKKQVDTKCYDKFGLSPFHYAIIFNKLDIVNFLLDEININLPNKFNYIPIQYAAAFCYKEIFKLLLNKGADINYKSETFIRLMIYINNTIEKDINNQEKCNDFVKFLLANECDINSSNKQDFPPLIIAVYYGYEELVKLLIKNSADLNCRDIYGRSALHVAACKSNLDVLKLLLEGGIDINQRDNAGNSVLHYALKNTNNCFQIVVFLMENGANPHVTNLNGITPLHIAVANGNLDEIKLLFSRTYVNAQDNQGDTALHYAVSNNNMEVVKYLIDYADVNLSNEKDLTPLDIAHIAGHKEIASYLERFGAHLKNKNAESKEIRMDKSKNTLSELSIIIEQPESFLHPEFIKFYLDNLG